MTALYSIPTIQDKLLIVYKKLYYLKNIGIVIYLKDTILLQ